MTGRYEASGPEAEFQPGSRGRVRRNRLGITSVRLMQHAESETLLAATQQIIDVTDTNQRFTADDIRSMHRHWLGEVYELAGDYRQVNIAKGGFMFAAASRVPRLMQDFELGPLRDYRHLRSLGKQGPRCCLNSLP